MREATTFSRTLQRERWRSIGDLPPHFVPGPLTVEDSDPRFFFHQKSREPPEAARRHRVQCPSGVLRSGRL